MNQVGVKFLHSPILHYAFSSWREKILTKNTFPPGKQICFTIVWSCAEFYPGGKEIVTYIRHRNSCIMKRVTKRILTNMLS